MRIFIIDDSLVMRTVIGRVLSTNADCELVGASHCPESARTAIADLKPDVVTLDISMPGLDGFNYLDELRAVVHPAIVVVSASTRAGSRSAEKALASGADACFDKALIVIESELFVETLRGAVRRHRRARPENGPMDDLRRHFG